jgi:hypothetical protein
MNAAVKTPIAGGVTVVPTYLVAAAETARRLGPGSPVTVVAPRRAGLAQFAKIAAEQAGVQVHFLQIKNLTVRIQFVAEAPTPTPRSELGWEHAARRWIETLICAGRRVARAIRRPMDPPALREAHWD